MILVICAICTCIDNLYKNIFIDFYIYTLICLYFYINLRYNLMTMGQTVCFANNKGGVGKTTTAKCIAEAWARMGKKVLCVDLDSQANLTTMLSPIEPGEREVSIRDAFINPDLFTIEHVAENIDLVPSDLSLSNFDRDTASIAGREYLLLDLLKNVKDNYDFIVIDCPPALGLITYNAMIAADHLVMVTTADALSYSGLVMVANLFADVKSNERLNKGLKLTGVVVTRYEKNRLSELYLSKIKEELGQAFISPVIRKATKMQQAASIKQSIYDLDPSGKATADYIDVAQNLALRILQ